MSSVISRTSACNRVVGELLVAWTGGQRIRECVPGRVGRDDGGINAQSPLQ
jgi:hypothetical protein